MNWWGGKQMVQLSCSHELFGNWNAGKLNNPTKSFGENCQVQMRACKIRPHENQDSDKTGVTESSEKRVWKVVPEG